MVGVCGRRWATARLHTHGTPIRPCLAWFKYFHMAVRLSRKPDTATTASCGCSKAGSSASSFWSSTCGRLPPANSLTWACPKLASLHSPYVSTPLGCWNQMFSARMSQCSTGIQSRSRT